MQTYPVNTVDDAYNACYPDEPLGPSDPRYVDLTPVRGGKSLATIIGRRIRRTRPPLYHQQLVSGHRGSGKSTELRRLQQELRDAKLFAVYLDVEDLLDLGELRYQDVLVAIAQAVERDLRAAGVAINKELLEELRTWFDERILTNEQKRDIEASLKAEASIEGKLPFLARALASITSQIKSGSSQKQEIRHKLEQELSGFIERLNILLKDAQRNISGKGFVDLVVLVDGLEKMQYHLLNDGESTHSLLFIHHAAQLRAPQCHLVYTVPISLAFRASLGNSFSDAPFLLPMVDNTCPEGKTCLREVVSKRIDIARVFDAEATVDTLIEMSGGAVRDLLRLIRMACDDALDQITKRDAEAAVRSLTTEFDRFLKDEDIAPLLEVAQTRTISYNDTAARLLELRMVHEYQNLLDERWADIHPALRRTRRLQRKLAGGTP
jgi:hypothetical protein